MKPGSAKSTKAAKPKKGAGPATEIGTAKGGHGHSTPLVVAAASLALRPRPEPAPEILAAITAAAQMVWPQPALPEAEDIGHDAWRFSGRWWALPTPMRRARPWARR